MIQFVQQRKKTSIYSFAEVFFSATICLFDLFGALRPLHQKEMQYLKMKSNEIWLSNQPFIYYECR